MSSRPWPSPRHGSDTLFRVEPLVDSWGRAIASLRVSVTDKCNFRCTYCMPAEGLEWLPKREVLSFEEIERLVRVLARMGVREVRLTGGEPLVRRDLPELVRMLAAVPGVEDLSLTTNGVLLDRLAGRSSRCRRRPPRPHGATASPTARARSASSIRSRSRSARPATASA